MLSLYLTVKTAVRVNAVTGVVMVWVAAPASLQFWNR
jgi:hypothetical protein